MANRQAFPSPLSKLRTIGMNSLEINRSDAGPDLCFGTRAMSPFRNSWIVQFASHDLPIGDAEVLIFRAAHGSGNSANACFTEYRNGLYGRKWVMGPETAAYRGG